MLVDSCFFRGRDLGLRVGMEVYALPGTVRADEEKFIFLHPQALKADLVGTKSGSS